MTRPTARTASVAFGVTLGVFALWAAADHTWWAASCTAPIARGDSPRHALWAVTWTQAELRDPSPLGTAVLLAPSYYPSFTTWLALPVLKALGPTGAHFRACLGLFSGVLALGTGLVAARTSGRLAGLAAAALTTVIPLFWTLRAEVMLDLPLAAMVALFLGLLPDEPGCSRPGLALGAGVALGLGLLTKQTMPYLAAPAVLVLAARGIWAALPGRRLAALVGLLAGTALPAALFLAGQGGAAVLLVGAGAAIAALAAHRAGRPHLRDLAVVALVATAIAGAWTARSAGPILAGLRITGERHEDVPGGLGGAVRILGMVEYVAFDLLPAPVVVLAGLGVALLPWRGRQRPLLWAVLAALVGGHGLISSFPDLHGRHYAPLVPLAAVLAVVPLGQVAAWKAGRAASTLLLLAAWAWSGALALSWHRPLPVSPGLRVSRADADIPPDLPPRDLALVLARLARWPRLLRLAAPDPAAELLPLDEALTAILADAPGPFTLWSVDPAIEDSGLQLVLDEAGLSGVRPLSHPTAEEVRSALANETVYAFDLVAPGGRSGRFGADPLLAGLGFAPLLTLPARLAERPGRLGLVVSRAGPGGRRDR